MKRRLTQIAKSILLLSGGVLILLLLYVLFNLDLFHRAKPLSAAEMQTWVLQVGSSGALQYVAEKFDTHAVVFLGELHKRKQDLDFLKELIPYLYRTKGIKIIGWEFGAANDQEKADSIVTAAEFDRAKAIAVMRNGAYDWCFEDYLDVFKTIWQLNKTIPQDSSKLRFLQLNKPYIPRNWHSQNDSVRLKERETSFDNILPRIVEKEVIAKNEKILIYCGLHHSLTKFKTPKFFFLKDNDGRAGQRLYEKYPGKIFQICLLSPFPPRWLFYKELTNGKDIQYVYPFDAVFNQLYDTVKRPFAVDAGNPAFADLKDHGSFYAFDRLNGIRLKDFCDGAIMLASFDNIQPVAIIPDWVTTAEETEAVRKVLPEAAAQQIRSVQDLVNYINPASSLQQIKKFHSLKKFW